ncbi:MAG: VWA domain-containing protein [Myxococcales bacterium FL481]|nr:MAG: VWA domain-containing protein [Myxococcales bacterium FL481]
MSSSCRQVVNGAPAVAVYFSVEFCAGVPITPEKMGELGASIKVIENGGHDVTDDEEAHATIISKSVESYVHIVLDVSKSFTEGGEELGLVIPEVRNFVQELASSPAGEVYLALSVFGRGVAEFHPFTADLNAVDGALAEIEADPGAAASLVGGDGSSLYLAVERGILETERMREFRAAVTSDGVLTTGAVLVITDGRDNSGGELNTALIDGTQNNVISLGVGYEIDDNYLDPIGRDGSFLAPEPEDWQMAFAEISQRVEDYPRRSYLLGYCSAGVVGEQEVTVDLAFDSADPFIVKTASCVYDANLFAPDPAPECNGAFFESEECATRACGGLSACGGCADDRCCAGGSCHPPGARSECDTDDQLCRNYDDTTICAEEGQDAFVCAVPQDLDQPCNDSSMRCELGVTWCEYPEEEDGWLGAWFSRWWRTDSRRGEDAGEAGRDRSGTGDAETADTGSTGTADGGTGDGTGGTDTAGGSATGSTGEPEDDDDKVGTCRPVRALGERCDLHDQCASLVCEKSKESNPLDPPVCQPGAPGARMFRKCDHNNECEVGTFCDGSSCAPKSRYVTRCKSAAECHYGQCYDTETDGKYCAAAGCFWSWNEKLP